MTDPAAQLPGRAPRVLISIDMEGVAGIATRRQVVPGQPNYTLARTLMTHEANAAAAGAFDAGANAVLVNDSHGPMENLLGEDLDPRVEYVVGSPKPLSMMQGLAPGIDVALMVGYHGGAHEPTGVLAHTYSTQAFAEIRLNGEPLTELLLNALLASAYDVPVGLVTGDDVICAYAEKLLPGVVTVPVKSAIGYSAARSKHPATARDLIRSGAVAAVAAAGTGSVQPLRLPEAFVVEAELRPMGAAEELVKVPGSQRFGARGVRRAMRDPQEMLDVIDIWASLAAGYAS